MPIPLICTNGHKLNAQDHLLGKTVRCPKCQEPVLVEMPVVLDEEEAIEIDPFGNLDPLADMLPSPSAALPGAQVSSQPGAGSQPGTSWQAPTRTVEVRPHLFETIQGKLGIVGSGLGAGGLLALMLLGIISLFRGGSSAEGNLASTDSGGGGDVAGDVESGLPPGGPNPNDPVVREAVGKIKQVYFGLMNYNEQHRAFPPGTPKQSKLSWRVHILPYIDQQALYKKFNLNEPWDSPQNLPLLKEMPGLYKLGDATEKTCFQIIASEGTWYGGDKPPKLSDFTDGFGTTLNVVVTGSDKAVEWTRPDDFSFDKENPVASLGKLPGDVIVSHTGNETIAIGTQIDPKQFLALVTHKGNEYADPLRAMQETVHLSPIEFQNGRPPQAYMKPGELPKPIAPRGGKFTIQQQLQVASSGLMTHNADFRVLGPRAAPTVGALSWRVHILPYLGHTELYRQFELSEAWDSPTNSKLLGKIPACYNTGDGNKTRIQASQQLLGYKGACRLESITDPANATILLMATPAALATEWTKPDEFGANAADYDKLKSALGKDSLHVVTCSMQALKLDSQTVNEHLQALITINGNEKMDTNSITQGALVEMDNGLRDRFMGQMGKELERTNRMKQIMLAMHNYESTYRRFPPAAGGPTISKADGKEHLSWRVLLLPFLDQVALYNQFKLDEPWDSPHNKTLIDKMPSVFADPAINSYTASCVSRVTGPGTMFSKTIGPKYSDVRNASATIAIIHVTPDESQPWTKPVDLEVDISNPITLKSWPTHRFIVGYVDGSIKKIKSNVPPDILGSLLSAQGSTFLTEEENQFGL